MSKLGKIFLWIALVGAIAAVGAGIALILKYNDTKVNLANTEAARQTAVHTIEKDKVAYTELSQAKAKTDADLATANTNIADLNTQLDAAKKQAADANTALETANANVKAEQDKLDAISKSLGGRNPDEVVAEATKTKADLDAAEAEKKILQDSLQESQTKVADLMDALNRSKTGTMPPGISGKVTFVDLAWNFVILDVGLSNGVVPNGELIVYRGKTFLGKVRVTKVDPNDAVAEILPDVKGAIQIGDKVIN
jgi:multidrug efflux pump subunit AcrA (membrane-fusion protein)